LFIMSEAILLHIWIIINPALVLVRTNIRIVYAHTFNSNSLCKSWELEFILGDPVSSTSIRDTVNAELVVYPDYYEPELDGSFLN